MSDQLPGPIHREMTAEEFDDFPRHLGWKYEYYGSKIHVTPRPACVPLILRPGATDFGRRLFSTTSGHRGIPAAIAGAQDSGPAPAEHTVG